MVTTIIIISIIAIAIFGTVAGILGRFRKCPSNKLLVIYGSTGKDTNGKNKSAKVIHGGLQFVWPVIQSYQYLDLSPMSIEIDLRNALSNQNIRVDVPASVTISISQQEGIMQNAANHLLDLDQTEIKRQASEIIFGQMRQVISNMSIEEINTDRDKFLSDIQKNLETELNKIGLKLINVNIKDISDESGYINALGKEAAAKAINEAKVRVSEENQKGDVGSSRADQLRRKEVAEANSLAEIGEADATSSMRIKTSEANSRAIDGENTAQIKIAQSESSKLEAQAEAKRRSETAERVKLAKTQEDSYKAQQIAEEARASKDKASQYADTVIPAEIARDKMLIDAKAEADKNREIAKGETDAVYAKMEAQARGMKELLEKQAEGFESLVKAAGGDAKAAIQMMITDKLPELLKIQTDALQNIKIDKVVVWDSGKSDNGAGGLAGFTDNFLKSMPGMKSIYDLVGEDGQMPQMFQSAKEIAQGKADVAEATIVDNKDGKDSKEKSGSGKAKK